MEGIGFILIGAALFSHSWYLMELYAEGRAVGVIMAVLGVAMLVTLTFEPQILGTAGSAVLRTGDVSVMKATLVLWSVYAIAVGAQGFFDLEEHNVRAIGFYAAILAVAAALSLFYFSSVINERYGNGAVIALSLTSLLLALTSAFLFAYLGAQFRALKPVAGWFMLIGGVLVVLIGLAMTTTIVVAQS